MLSVLLVLLLALAALGLFLGLKLKEIAELRAFVKRLQYDGAEACVPCKNKDEQLASLQARVQKERRRHKAVEENWRVPLRGFELAKRATELLRFGPLRIGVTQDDPIYEWAFVEQETRRIEQELELEA